MLVGDSTNHSAQIFGAVAAGWLGWYTWKFFISPLLYRDEPKELPYLIPCKIRISLLDLSLYANNTLRKRFGNDPWAVTIMGESLYVIPSAEDVLAVYRAPKTLDFDPFIKEMLSKYGITAETASKMFDTLPGQTKNWMETMIENFKTQMHPGEKLDHVQTRLLGFIDHSLVWGRLHGRMVLEDGGNERVVSLYNWSEVVIVDAQTRAFFDDALYKECPDLLAQFQIYEDEAWKLPMDLPDFATKALRSSKINIESGLRRYLKLSRDERPNDSWLIDILCKDMDKLGLEEDQKVYVLFSFYRVMNANAYKLVFWIISYLLFHPQLMEELKVEIEPAFRDGNHSTPDLSFLFDSCPLLASICEEVLRLTNWPIGTRTVQTDTIIGGKKLRQGRKLLMPYRAMHFDPAVFGADATAFNPKRFIMKKTLVTHKSYRPFGGAAHYCPGRYIARREVQMFTAVMLMRFEITLLEGEGPGNRSHFPKMDDTLPSGGIQVPSKGEDLIVRVRPSKAV
ncbi:cytochrome P450 [Paraphaeosphaeria sporulosa]|uniref:Cytochrome P450 n=1 Tax=Paraphaeosphaeria sporulosa TaxID=1460663 RepID=A0A177BUX0_9PLEO|nr:cytochrome P450 [Paraphaeosphaeria sporulosa]OAF98770.1 cytochrome P450 [Paraphaeosphaeria sporulosa]